MSTPNLNSFIAIPIPAELYAALARRYPDGVSSLIEQVTWDFLERTADDFEAGRSKCKGFHWDSVFLPEGTEIRTKYFNEYKVATIQREELVWEGKTYPSMSQLARVMRGDTSNNAWKVLEVKRPTDLKWQSAQFLRR